MRMDNDRLTRKAFMKDRECMHRNSWSSNVANILRTINMAENWDRLDVVNLRLASERLMDEYRFAWKARVCEKPKRENYKILNANYEAANHIMANVNRAGRALMSQLRTGYLGLFIETGRYGGVERTDRICVMCKAEVEDEHHFLFRCSKTSKLSNYPNINNIENCNEKMILLSAKPHCFSRFVKKLWNLRIGLVSNNL